MTRKAQPKIDPLPTVGGAYLLDSSTGKWVLEGSGNEEPAPAPAAVPVDTNENGTDSEAPAAGED